MGTGRRDPGSRQRNQASIVHGNRCGMAGGSPRSDSGSHQQPQLQPGAASLLRPAINSSAGARVKARSTAEGTGALLGWL
jgi:hypothetical protein